MVFPIFGKKPGSFLRLQGAFRGYGTGLIIKRQKILPFVGAQPKPVVSDFCNLNHRLYRFHFSLPFSNKSNLNSPLTDGERNGNRSGYSNVGTF